MLMIQSCPHISLAELICSVMLSQGATLCVDIHIADEHSCSLCMRLM